VAEPKTLRELGLEVPGLKAQGQAVKSLRYPIGVEAPERAPGLVTVLVSAGEKQPAVVERFARLDALPVWLRELVLLHLVPLANAKEGIAADAVMLPMLADADRAAAAAAAVARRAVLDDVRARLDLTHAEMRPMQDRIAGEVQAWLKLEAVAAGPGQVEVVRPQDEIDAEAVAVVEGLIAQARRVELCLPKDDDQ